MPSERSLRDILGDFFGKAGRLVAPEVFSFMLSLLSDAEVLLVLDRLFKRLALDCERYCPLCLDYQLFGPDCWPWGLWYLFWGKKEDVVCPYLLEARRRLAALDGSILLDWRIDTCPSCFLPGIVVTVNVRGNGLRCRCVSCMEVFGVDMTKGGAVVG